MKLLKLALKNFKGIKLFEFCPEGRNVAVYGTNSTGKTTLYDAFLWLLFDRDSQNRTNFAIKTLDESGEPLHGLDHEVEATLNINGNTLILKKSYKEKWTKKRGQADAEFTGHTTDYFIDGVPARKSEYEAKIAEIANENIFKLLTNPAYFNEQLSWQDRRKALLEIAGDISTEKVIESNKELAELKNLLGKRTPEEYKKIIQFQKVEINKELEKIPVRIDEVSHNLPDISEIDSKNLGNEIEALKEKLTAKQDEINAVKNGGEIAKKEKQLAELETKILKMEAETHEKLLAQKIALHNKIHSVKEAITTQEFRLKRSKQIEEDNLKTIDTCSKKITELREAWHQVNAQQFEQSTICPTCQRELPEEKIEEATAAFNNGKAEKLKEITTEGQELSEKLNNLQAQIKEDRKVDKAVKDAINKLKNEDADLSNKLLAFDNETDNPDVDALLKQKDNLETEIATHKTGQESALSEIKEKYVLLEKTLAEAEEAKQKLDRHKEGQERIKRLKAEERELALQYEELEKQTHLLELFTRTKVGLLEDNINGMFKLAKFKLFDTQINGGINEVCETLYQGVPYSAGLNNAARINVGLDIITTLSRYHKFTPPIFIDNAEAVVKLLPVDAQVIRLIVSGKDKSLRVEAE